MPLTHRDHAHGVVFITGHAAPGGLATDWIQLGQLASQLKITLVIYMGVSSAAAIEAGLAVHMRADTPVVLVQNASSETARSAPTTLSHLSACIQQQAFASPMVMVIGDVASLANTQAINLSPRHQIVSLERLLEHQGYNAELVA
jgi:uroporphyrin-III C-methyltransferase